MALRPEYWRVTLFEKSNWPSETHFLTYIVLWRGNVRKSEAERRKTDPSIIHPSASEVAKAAVAL